MHVGMMTSWGIRCGLAGYAAFLLEPMTASDNVKATVLGPIEAASDVGPYPVSRCWARHEPRTAEVVADVRGRGIDIVEIQYQPAFLTPEELLEIVSGLAAVGVPAAVVIHSLPKRPLASVGRWPESTSFIFHRDADVALTPEGCRGLMIPLGSAERIPADRKSLLEAAGLEGRGPILAGFGYLQPHKGVVEMLRAMPRILEHYPDAVYVALSTAQSTSVSLSYYRECVAEIGALGLKEHAVILGRFLDDAEAMVALQVADVIVLPYSQTPEAASGPLGYALSSGRPVLTTAQPIFVAGGAPVFEIASGSPDDIAAGVLTLLADPARMEDLGARGAAWGEERSWTAMAARHVELFREMLKAT